MMGDIQVVNHIVTRTTFNNSLFNFQDHSIWECAQYQLMRTMWIMNHVRIVIGSPLKAKCLVCMGGDNVSHLRSIPMEFMSVAALPNLSRALPQDKDSNLVKSPISRCMLSCLNINGDMPRFLRAPSSDGGFPINS